MLVRFDVMVVHHSWEHEWVIRSECSDCSQAGESGQVVEIALVATDMADQANTLRRKRFRVAR